MARAIPLSLRRELERQETGEAALGFLEISHSSLAETIRVVSDGVDYVWRGETWIGFPYDMRMLTDTDEPPRAQLAVQDVDPRIGTSLRGLRGPARLKLDFVAASWFDQTVSPRVAIDDEPEPFLTMDKLFLINVEGDGLQLSGDIVSWDYLQEIWPGVRAVQNLLPGLFR